MTAAIIPFPIVRRHMFIQKQVDHAASMNPACSAPARWIREHGTDVSGKAGLRQANVLWLLPGVVA